MTGGGLQEGGDDSDGDTDCEERGPGHKDDDDDERMEIDEGKLEEEDEMKCRLYKLVAQSRLAYFSSTDDELDRVHTSEGDREQDEMMEEEDEEQGEEKTERLTSKLCQLENQVRASQFSSTEDELDRVGFTDEEKRTGDEEEEEEEELAVKVCKLAYQVNATQFSSTEDELDRLGNDEEAEEVIVEETLWKLQEEKAAQVRNLASLVSASQFSSTEDELERLGENEEETKEEVDEGGIESSTEMEGLWEGKREERSESMGDLDVDMFDSREEIEERKKQDKGEEVISSWQVEGKRERDESGRNGRMREGQRMEGNVREERQETAVDAERKEETAEEIMVLCQIRFGRENQPESMGSEVREAGERWKEEADRESNGSKEIASDSDDEDSEFDRMISSMLTMTLEDMQAGMKTDVGDDGGVDRELQETESKRGETGEEEPGPTVDDASRNLEGCDGHEEEDKVPQARTSEEEHAQVTGETTEARAEEEEPLDDNSTVQGGLLSPEEIHKVSVFSFSVFTNSPSACHFFTSANHSALTSTAKIQTLTQIVALFLLKFSFQLSAACFSFLLCAVGQ